MKTEPNRSHGSFNVRKNMKYRDKSLLGKRNYELLEESISTTGASTLGATFETEIPYTDFKAKPEKLKILAPTFWSGIYILSGGTAMITAVGIFQSQDKAFLTGLASAISFVGLFIVGIAFRKIELVRFRSKAGFPLLDIIKAGPLKGEFDSFVSELSARIQKATEPNQAATGSSR